MRFIEKIDGALSVACQAFEYIAASLLATMLIINAANIAMRNLAGISINWVWPWTMTLFIWWVLIAFFPLYRLKKDVSIYFILRKNNPHLKRVLGTCVYAAITAAMLVLLITGPERLASARGTIEIVGLPRIVLVLPLIASAALIFVDAVLNLFMIATGRRVYNPFGKIEVTE